MTRQPPNERGLTLTEVTVVMVLAAIVMTGLVGFYLNSQATWLDGSLQAISQREANLVLDTIRRRAQTAYGATSDSVDSAQHCWLAIQQNSADPPELAYYYWWSPSDSLIHEGYRLHGDDRGPMIQSKVDRFVVSTTGELVRVVALQVRTPQGHHITLATNVRLMNGGL
jgi:prepilin-type N-terminal cleavage/methylation domain-containing protein